MVTQTLSDHAILTTACGLVDRSERGKLALTGAQAAELLNGQVTNDVAALEPGQGQYAAFLTPKGKMLGDLRILRTSGELHLDCERGALQGLFDLLRRGAIGWDAELHKRTVQEALLSLVGPRARAVAGLEDLPAEEHACRETSVGAVAVLAAATDVGVDLFCAAGDAGALRAALTDAGAVEVPEAAAEVVRVESGRPRYGIDADDSTIPQEAGLNARAVSFTKGCYVGQETVARLHWRGKPNRHLRGLRLSGPEAQRGDVLVSSEGREVGRLGSVVRSPRLGPIALALVRREVEPGSTVSVGGGGVSAEVVELPFAPAAG
jgi:folate-binding protein YgfZ